MEVTGTLTRFKDFFGHIGTDIGAYFSKYDQTSLLGGCLFGIIVIGTIIVAFLILGKRREHTSDRSTSERRMAKVEGKLNELSNNWGTFLSNVRDDIGFIKQEIQELRVQLDFVGDIEKLHELLTEANKRMAVQLENHKSDQVLIACELREIRVSQARLETLVNEPRKDFSNAASQSAVRAPQGSGVRKANGTSEHTEARQAAAFATRSRNEQFFVD